MGEIKVAGITLDVDITGEGPPLLYLPAESFGPLHSPFLTGLSEHWSGIRGSTGERRQMTSAGSRTWLIFTLTF